MLPRISHYSLSYKHRVHVHLRTSVRYFFLVVKYPVAFWPADLPANGFVPPEAVKLAAGAKG